jgi:hypothetical protein
MMSCLAFSDARATPAYARRFDTACATCHAPLPPRLNNVGALFHRYGFRLPDADENGTLILKMIPAHGIMDATSISAQFEARHDPEAEPGTSRTTMALGEVEFVGGTSIGDHLSGQYMFLPHNAEGETELEDFEVQANVGQPGSQFSVRGGKMQTFLWQKGNHGSVTPSMPLILDEEPMVPVGDFAGFALGTKEIGVEAGYTHTSLNKGRVLATMLSAAALNGVTEDGMAASRNPTDGVDILLQAYELIGSRNTIGVFYYNGRTIVDAEGLLLPPGPFHDRFHRTGFLGSFAPVERFELTAGAMTGNDHSEQLGTVVTTRGGYVEATGTILTQWVATWRWEVLDPDKDVSNDEIHADVLATTYQLWDHLLLQAEYRQLREPMDRPHTILGIIRLVY